MVRPMVVNPARSTIIFFGCLLVLLSVVFVAPASADRNMDPMIVFSRWYLPEGSTAWGFDTYVTIENPNNGPVPVGVTYNTDTGPVAIPDITLPAASQTTLNPRDTLGSKDFSTYVEAKEDGMEIGVDRTMSWTGQGAASPEGHCSIGFHMPYTGWPAPPGPFHPTWYLPEGSSAHGFECWLLVQNPYDQAAEVKITYMVENEGPKSFTKTVPASSRRSFNMAEDIGAKDASIEVESDKFVIAERSVYRDGRREGHDSIGTIELSKDYYLPEGSTAWGFTTYVLVQNPQTTPTDVTITYMTPNGPLAQPKFTMPANSRRTVRVNDVSPANGYPINVSNTDLSTKVSGSKPIIAERAMYWGAGTALGEATHDSIGVPGTSTVLYLPDGQTGGGHETWTLVQNPNSKSVEVEIEYLTPTGQGNVKFKDTIPARSRKTYNMADKLAAGRAGVVVRGLKNNDSIMAERAMYWNNRGAGTDTIGGTDTQLYSP